jgi:GTP cyclohydrolase I
MSNKLVLTHAQVERAALGVVRTLAGTFSVDETVAVYAVPRGGVPAAYLVKALWPGNLVLLDNPDTADVFIDDLIDSGETMRRYCDAYPGKPFLTLFEKVSDFPQNPWLVFPWENNTASDEPEETVEDNIRRILQYIGEDPNREGLQETPRRVVKAWETWFGGYKQDPASVMKVFEDGAERCDEMVLVKDIPVFSHCEHHIAPILGVAHVAYIPNGKILGLSKIARLVDMFARRLQVQERLTNQIADAMQEHLSPLGIAVVIEAEHTCMTTRGVKIAGGRTTTSAMRGAFRDEHETRAEFMGLIK